MCKPYAGGDGSKWMYAISMFWKMTSKQSFIAGYTNAFWGREGGMEIEYAFENDEKIDDPKQKRYELF